MLRDVGKEQKRSPALNFHISHSPSASLVVLNLGQIRRTHILSALCKIGDLNWGSVFVCMHDPGGHLFFITVIHLLKVIPS